MLEEGDEDEPTGEREGDKKVSDSISISAPASFGVSSSSLDSRVDVHVGNHPL